MATRPLECASHPTHTTSSIFPDLVGSFACPHTRRSICRRPPNLVNGLFQDRAAALCIKLLRAPEALSLRTMASRPYLSALPAVCALRAPVCIRMSQASVRHWHERCNEVPLLHLKLSWGAPLWCSSSGESWQREGLQKLFFPIKAVSQRAGV